MEKKKKSKRANGGLSHSPSNSQAERLPITGSSAQEKPRAKQSTSDQKKKQDDSTLPSWVFTDHALLAEMINDQLNTAEIGGFLVAKEEAVHNGLPVINLLLAAPRGCAIYLDDSREIAVRKNDEA